MATISRPIYPGARFCQRFELLARNGAAAASAPPAPVREPQKEKHGGMVEGSVDRSRKILRSSWCFSRG